MYDDHPVCGLYMNSPLKPSSPRINLSYSAARHCLPTVTTMFWLSLVLVWTQLFSSSDATVESLESSERQLVNQLLSRYSQLGTVARPVLNTSSCVQVRFGLRLVHVDLDEKEQVMRTSVWIRMRWFDEMLTWNSSEFGGVKSVILDPRKIWVPDISLVNTATTEFSEHHTGISVKSSGETFWAPMRTYTSACLIDVTEYPYDRHTCEMWFQSVANPSKYLNISAYDKSPLDMDTYLSSYKDAQEWEIVSNETSWHKRPRDAGMILMWSRRAAQRFVLTLQRRPGFQAMLLIVPCTLLSLLIPVVFCIPPERPDRHTLAMSLFASLTILLFMVNDVAPPSSSFVPKLALYYCFNLMILLLATCCSAVVVNVSKRGHTKDRVPKIVRKVFIDCLGHCLCFGKEIRNLAHMEQKTKTMENDVENLPAESSDQNGKENTMNTENLQLQQVTKDSKSDLFVLVNRRLDDLEKEMLKKNTSSPISNVFIMEWNTLAMVLDRMFFIVFIITDLISLGVFHPKRP